METVREKWTDERLDDLNGKVDDLGRRMDLRFEAMDRRFDVVLLAMVTGFLTLAGLIVAQH
jgi:hypothetical protein